MMQSLILRLLWIQYAVGYLRIIRPVNCGITFISVLVGAWAAKMIVMPVPVIIAGIAGFVVCAFGNVINDLADIEIDRVNNPGRPLPAGSITKRGATIFAAALAAASLVLAFRLGLFPLFVVVITLAMLVCYSLFLKKNPFGNIAVSIIAGLSFLFGGIITGNIFSVVPFIFAVLIHMPREIVKDVIDIKGDRAAGVRSLPILWGERRSLYIASVFLVLLFVLIPLPYILHAMSIAYLVIVVIGAYPLLVLLVATMLREPSSKSLSVQSRLIKAVMGIGLVGFLCG